MRDGLTQGTLGRKLATFAPSPTAVGPNTYLTRQDFFKMLGIAFAVHVVLIAIAGFITRDTVTNIPVRALSFKLGDQDQVAALGSESGVGITMNSAPAAPAMHSDSWQATPEPAPKPHVQPTPRPVKMPKVVEREPAPRPLTKQQPLSPLPTSPAIAPTPQQYVREAGGAPQASGSQQGGVTGLGAPNGMAGGQGTQSSGGGTSEEIRLRYEQQISNWIGRHMIYPANGAGQRGRVVIRMRIDRTGYVRYCAIEESSGVQALDAAAMDMIRRANPVPAVPNDYPEGTLIDFLIPINLAPTS